MSLNREKWRNHLCLVDPLRRVTEKLGAWATSRKPPANDSHRTQAIQAIVITNTQSRDMLVEAARMGAVQAVEQSSAISSGHGLPITAGCNGHRPSLARFPPPSRSSFPFRAEPAFVVLT